MVEARRERSSHSSNQVQLFQVHINVSRSYTSPRWSPFVKYSLSHPSYRQGHHDGCDRTTELFMKRTVLQI